MAIRIPPPELQIEFSFALAEIRRLYLQGALRDSVRNIEITTLDRQLGKFVPSNAMKTMAAHGLRAEPVFATPILFKSNPRLLGYYRLLFGFSQKVGARSRIRGMLDCRERRSAQHGDGSP